MVLFTLLGLVGTFTMTLPPPPAGTAATPQMMSTILHVGVIVSTTIGLVFVFLYWKGFSWMRWVVMVYCLFPLVSLLKLSTTMQASHINGVDCILNALLAIFLLYYLNTAPVKTWFDSPKA